MLAHLIESHYDGDLVSAIRLTLGQVRGAFALGVISSDAPGTLIFARNGASPLIVGVGDDEMYVASDIPAMLHYTRKVVVLEEGEVVEVTRDGYALRSTNYWGKPKRLWEAPFVSVERECGKLMFRGRKAGGKG